MKYKVFMLVLLSSLIWIVVLAPANIMARLLPVNSSLVLQGITGSVWSGAVSRAALIVDSKMLAQGRVEWQIRPLSMLRLSPCVDFNIDNNGPQASGGGSSAIVVAVAGVACVSTSGKLAMRDVAFDMPAAIFLRSPELRLGGEISGQLTELEWQSGSLVDLRGQGLWTDAMILSDQLNLPLHTLPFDFRRENGDSVFVELDNKDLLAQQQGTPMHVSLQSTVALDGGFYTLAQLTTQPQTPVAVIELLNVLAEPQGAGVFTLEVRSKLLTVNR